MVTTLNPTLNGALHTIGGVPGGGVGPGSTELLQAAARSAIARTTGILR